MIGLVVGQENATLVLLEGKLASADRILTVAAPEGRLRCSPVGSQKQLIAPHMKEH